MIGEAALLRKTEPLSTDFKLYTSLASCRLHKYRLFCEHGLSHQSKGNTNSSLQSSGKGEMIHGPQMSVVTTVLQPITATAAHSNRTGDVDLMKLVIYQKRQTQTNNHPQNKL